MKKILVTGGAGYIGSICVEELIKQGQDVIVVDNLQEGHRQAVSSDADFYQGDFGNKAFLEPIFKRHDIEAVMHFAAETTIEVSMSDPQIYFANNVINGIHLLDTMKKYGCKKMIFSSTAATFGNPVYVPIDEKHPQTPINAYGESKLMFEKILEWYHMAYGFMFNAFRYFNAAGASERLGEAHRSESHLIPLLIRAALGTNEKFYIFGDDYDTKDGTCVRDYIHVIDLARAHILGLKKISENPASKYNLGNGSGFTNLEVVRMVGKISGKNIDYEMADRRPGDPAILIARTKLAEDQLGWVPKYDSLETIVRSAWKWHLRNPDGYKEVIQR